MSRKYKTLTDRHCFILCHKCEAETTIELHHSSLENEDGTTETKITWACRVCKDRTADYTPFLLTEWRKVLDYSLELRNRLVLRQSFAQLFPEGLEFRTNEAFHTLLQRGNLEIARNRVIDNEEKTSCCICYSPFVKRERTAVN